MWACVDTSLDFHGHADCRTDGRSIVQYLCHGEGPRLRSCRGVVMYRQCWVVIMRELIVFNQVIFFPVVWRPYWLEHVIFLGGPTSSCAIIDSFATNLPPKHHLLPMALTWMLMIDYQFSSLLLLVAGQPTFYCLLFSIKTDEWMNEWCIYKALYI